LFVLDCGAFTPLWFFPAERAALCSAVKIGNRSQSIRRSGEIFRVLDLPLPGRDNQLLDDGP
jgi:hypothetical protein